MRRNAFGQRLRDDAPELPGDYTEHCGACGLAHDDDDCDLDPANLPAVQCHYCGRSDRGICDDGTAQVGEPICHQCTRELRDDCHRTIVGLCTHTCRKCRGLGQHYAGLTSGWQPCDPCDGTGLVLS